MLELSPIFLRSVVVNVYSVTPNGSRNGFESSAGEMITQDRISFTNHSGNHRVLGRRVSISFSQATTRFQLKMLWDRQSFKYLTKALVLPEDPISAVPTTCKIAGEVKSTSFRLTRSVAWNKSFLVHHPRRGPPDRSYEQLSGNSCSSKD